MAASLAWVVYTDGGARGNPGPAGIGIAVYTPTGQLIHTWQEYIGTATNNQAEYQAVIVALAKAKQLGVRELSFFLDSELVVKQLNGEYKVKDKTLGGLFVKIWNQRSHFSRITWRHVPRAENTVADRLVNEAIDQALAQR